MCDVYGKHVLLKKMFTNGLSRGLQLRPGVEETVNNSPVIKTFQAQRLVKKAMLTVFWVMKWPIIIDFPEKVATVKSASNCKQLRKNSPYLWNDPRITIALTGTSYEVTSVSKKIKLQRLTMHTPKQTY